ncbi:MAG: hypothetical protein ACLR6J_09895 [Parabacteroides merdae]
MRGCLSAMLEVLLCLVLASFLPMAVFLAVNGKYGKAFPHPYAHLLTLTAFIAEQVKMRMPTLFLPLNPLDSRWLQMYNTFRKNHTVCRIVFYSREVKGYLLSEVVKEE